MKSVIAEWVDCSDLYFNTVSGNNVTTLYDALQAAQDAEAAVVGAGDIGSVTLSVTYNDIEILNEKRRRLVSFCNGIHYEISQIVDNPFAVKAGELMNRAYDLNPEDYNFTTPKGWWFIKWDKTITLQDLMMEITTDEKLKEDFSDRFNKLDDDESPYELDELYLEAKYWEAEFKKSDECQQIAEEVFTPEVRANWSTMSEADRKKVVEDYVDQISNVMFGKDTTVKFNASGYGVSSPGGFLGIGRKIAINPGFVSNPTQDYCIDLLIDSVTHEMRHQYQDQQLNHPNKYDTPDSVMNGWILPYPDSSKDFDAYYRHPKEIDANGFAALSNPED